jgi:hypothetical protein
MLDKWKIVMIAPDGARWTLRGPAIRALLARLPHGWRVEKGERI